MAIFMAVFPFLAFTQNLIPNPSFETANCPTGYNGAPGQVALYIPDWYSANCASPDPMTNCSNHAQTSVPDVWFGSTYARTGNNYMGLGFYQGWYEYIGAQLTQPLTQGETYYVSFYVRCAQQAKYASDAMGIYFSNTQIICTSGFSGPVLPYVPQVVQTPGVFLSDTSGWVEVSGTYTAAGGEEYIVLGCFNAWNVNNLLDIGGSAGRCYYYTDDISVQNINSLVPAQPDPISGEIDVCENSVRTYSIPPVPGATAYSWTLPPGWTGNSTTNSITVTVGSNSGNISVTADNNFGPSIAQTLAVTVQTIPVQPVSITGPLILCPGASATYQVLPVSNANTYTWILPSGWAGNSTTNSINITAAANSGAIQVTADNHCGSSPAASLAITLVDVDVNIINNNGTLSVSNTADSYQWVDCATNFTAILNETQHDFTPSITGDYAVIAEKSGCIDTSGCMHIEINPTGNELQENAPSAFSLFPNPAQDWVNIIQDIPSGLTSISIMDITGKMVYQEEITTATKGISLLDFSPGIYVVQLTDGWKYYHQKLTIVK